MAGLTPEQEREIEAREECVRRGIDPDDICADGGVLAWMVVDQENKAAPPNCRRYGGMTMGIERLREPCPKWAANKIDRLHAELASRKIDVETFSEGNRQLRAELVAMTKRAEAAEDNIGCQADLEKDFADARAELAALEERCIDGEKVILRCNKKISEVEIWNKEYRDQLAEARRALLASNDIVLANKKLQEDNAAKDGIIANLNERSAQYERDAVAQAARIAELEKDNSEIAIEALRDHRELRARAERAEAELKLLRGDIKIIDALQAERDAMREALEGMIAVVEGRFDGNPHADIDALAKARAALAPPPAATEE